MVPCGVLVSRCIGSLAATLGGAAVAMILFQSLAAFTACVPTRAAEPALLDLSG
jgi:hypothetical protein